LSEDADGAAPERGLRLPAQRQVGILERVGTCQMQWFRWNRRWGSYAALFALALQLVLSFGHFHPDEFGIAIPGAAPQASNSLHPGKLPGSVPDADELCAICAVISMSGALMIPQPPELVFAAAHHEAFFQNVAAVLVSSKERGRFQARAPPA